MFRDRMTSPYIGESYGGFLNLDLLSRKLSAELPDGYSPSHSVCGSVTVTMQAELLLLRAQLAQLLVAVPDFLVKISALLQTDNVPGQQAETRVSSSPEAPSSPVCFQETTQSSANAAPMAAQIRTGKPGASCGPRPPLTAAERAYRRENYLCLYCASPEHFLHACPLCRPRRGESPAYAGIWVGPQEGPQVVPAGSREELQVQSVDPRRGSPVQSANPEMGSQVQSVDPRRRSPVQSANPERGSQVLPICPGKVSQVSSVVPKRGPHVQSPVPKRELSVQSGCLQRRVPPALAFGSEDSAV